MTLYRGAGGGGNSTDDALVSEVQEYATEAQTSATAAATSASNASTSAASAATQASNAAASASTAAGAISSANSAVTLAQGYASDAEDSADDAAAALALTETYRNQAQNSANSASSSATTATNQASLASGYVTTAQNFANAASTSASQSSTYATNSATSATASATSATAAATSASAAASSATDAADSATDSATSATASASSATSAASSAASAATIYDNFDDRYLGAKPTDPSVDNDGNALLTGALYFNTGSNTMKVYTGSSWAAGYVTLSGALVASNNLSDLTVPADARTNIGLGNVTNESKATMFTSPTFTGTSTFNNGVQIDGDLTVSGTTVTLNATNLAVEDNMIYLNEGSTVANPDLGIAGNYNDGTYRHGGVFRDASDGKWKFFKNYTPEPDASAYIDTSHASFALADVQANNFTGTLTGNVTGDVTGNVSGNAGTVTNGVYTSGSYADPAWITGLSETKVLPNQSGNSGKVLKTNGTATSWGTLSTSDVAEVTNLYYTDDRVRAAISVSGSLSYNSSTGVISYTTPSTSGITEGTNLYYTDARARSSLSASTGISYNSTTGAISSTITQYTDALARAALSFTTGSGGYNSTTGVITIPTNTNELTNGAGFLSTAVTSITVSAGTGLTGGGTVTSSGTVTLSPASGYNGYGVRTVSTSAPSGGSNGDVWYKV